MNNRGYEYNEAYFAERSTNRNYAGPLDMPWIEEGMCMMQWVNGIVSVPMDRDEVDNRFFHPSTLARGEYQGCLCIWRIKAINT